ncbi:PEP-CTERM system TPR-repeat protein PrsT [Aquabacterium lacunae]|uniref:PEP-CTERM system TPR-repeat protein PrsT n=1 Tax=Aquabacterium lacunae TaxID=2528630 RepID=A0A4Q9H0I3_9BURK|nr:XrtA/PEP-CTERM system TPR-repeat protein PrsT [Aquabacterium lacunae]TBO28325.1 PEP-CTERM system TPR-repeat protein PrsT [Aquabacterium lacunae]
MNRLTHHFRHQVAAACCALLTACSGTQDPQAVMAAAKARMEAGEPAAAAIEIKNLMANDQAASGQLPALRSLLGQALLESGDPVGAEVELKRALQAGQPDDVVVPQLARALLAQQKHAELLNTLGGRQLASPDADAALRTTLATALRNRGEFGKATAEVNKALERKPEHVPALLLLASLHAADQRDKEAFEILQAVLRRDASNVQAWTIQGQLQAAKGQAAEAVAAFEKALKLKPDSVSAHAALVVLELSRNDVAAAKTRWEAMNKALPDNPQTRFHEAKVAFASGDARRARELTVPLLRTGDQNLGLLQLAAAVELKLKAPARAESLLGKAVALAPTAPVPRLMLAQAHLAGGQAAKATHVLRPLLQGEQPPEQALLLAARAALLQGAAQEADAWFAQAAKLYPGSQELANAAAVSGIRKNLTDDALNELQAVVNTQADHGAQLMLVSARLAKGQVEAAQATLAEMARKAPQDPFPHELAGRVALKQRDVAGARKHYEAALALDPAHYPAIAGLAGIDMADNQPDKALERFAKLLEREPDHLLALMAMAEVHERKPGGMAEAARLLERAVQTHPDQRGPTELLVELWLKQQKFTAAAAAAQSGLTHRPDDTGLLELLGKAQLGAAQAQQAATTYTKLAQLLPRSPEPWLRVAEIQLSQGRLAAATEAAAKARKVAPEALPVLRMVAGLAARAKRFDQALAAARDLQSAHPEEAAGYLIEGEVHLLEGDAGLAEKAWRLAMDKRNGTEAAQRLYALLSQQERKAEVDKMVAQWLSRHPKDTAFMLRLAGTEIDRKNYAAAEALLRKVHLQQPRNVDVLNNMAWLMTQQRKPGGVAYAERAMVFSPDNAVLMDTLAMAYATEKRFDEAIKTQTRAMTLMPESGALGLNLARIHLMAGDKPKATKVLQEVVAKPFAGQAEARQLLASLRGG